MRFLNLLGNKVFSARVHLAARAAPSRTRSAAPRSSTGRTTSASPPTARYFGDFDPFGDFDLLFGAARLSLPIVEMPVRYARRTAGFQVPVVSHGSCSCGCPGSPFASSSGTGGSGATDAGR